MKGFIDNIERLTEENTDFRRVLYTGHNLQLVLMAIPHGQEIGEEVHDDRDQPGPVTRATGPGHRLARASGRGRVIDISQAAAKEIGMHRSGTAKVSVALLED